MHSDRLREQLDLEVDGLLDEPTRRALHTRLESDLELASEHRALGAVHARLAASVIEPRRGFTGEVMRALPPAAWEGRTVSAWRGPFVLLLVLGGVAAALFGGAAADLEPSAPGFAAFSALTKLFGSTLLAGAGLAGASWNGLGLGLAQWLVESKLHLLLAAAVVVGLNFLLYRLLRPTSPRTAEVGAGPGRRTSRS